MEILASNWMFILVLISALFVTVMAQIKLQDNKYVETDGWGLPVWLTPIIYLFILILFRGTKILNYPLVFITLFIMYIFTGIILYFYNTKDSKIKWHYPIGYTIFVLILIA